MTRIAILTPDEMNDEQRAVIEASKANGKPHGGPFWAYIRNPKLMQNVQNMGACIADSTLSAREQQIVTLTVARFWGAKYYGFRVARHEEVEAAWKYIEANKEKYHLSKITKPQSAHFAYSIYFREPGGNHLEIEYYNPGGAQHGRPHTSGHWDTPLTDERFSERGYLPQASLTAPPVR